MPKTTFTKSALSISLGLGLAVGAVAVHPGLASADDTSVPIASDSMSPSDSATPSDSASASASDSPSASDSASATSTPTDSTSASASTTPSSSTSPSTSTTPTSPVTPSSPASSPSQSTSPSAPVSTPSKPSSPKPPTKPAKKLVYFRVNYVVTNLKTSAQVKALAKTYAHGQYVYRADVQWNPKTGRVLSAPLWQKGVATHKIETIHIGVAANATASQILAAEKQVAATYNHVTPGKAVTAKVGQTVASAYLIPAGAWDGSTTWKQGPHTKPQILAGSSVR